MEYFSIQIKYENDWLNINSGHLTLLKGLEALAAARKSSLELRELLGLFDNSVKFRLLKVTEEHIDA